MQVVSLMRLFLSGVVRSFTISLVVFALLMLMVVPAFAQDATPDPTPVIIVDPPEEVPDVEPGPSPLIDLNAAVERFFSFISELITDGLQSAKLWPVVAGIVGLIKYLPPVSKRIAEGRFSVGLLVFATAFIVWVGAAVSGWFGYGEQFRTAANWFVTIGPDTLQFLAVLLGAKWLHEAAANWNIPVLGKKVEKVDAPQDAVGGWMTTVTDPDGAITRTEHYPVGRYVTDMEVRRIVLDEVERKLSTSVG